MLPKTVLYYGSQEPPPERIELRAGPLSMIFEPQRAFLRRIRLGEQEALRGIYAAVRDHNWGTITPGVSNLTTDIGSDSFHITFDVECRRGDIDFFWRGTLTGTAQGRVRFDMEGVARSTFLRNRIGFSVLHPIRECAGKPCVIEKADGAMEQGVFPRHISPHQPFMDIAAIRHEIVPGLSAEVRFTGDLFEMEDQRNWTDASYKTYCTPLGRPFPVEVREGTTVSQSVTISLAGEVPASFPSVRPEFSKVVLTVQDRPPVPLLQIGLGAASHGQPLTSREQERLKRLNLSHLRVDLKLSTPDWPAAFTRAVDQATALGCWLEVALFLSDAAAELQLLAEKIKDSPPPVARWLVFQQDGKLPAAEWIQLARRLLSAGGVRAALGSGTNCYFAELNRNRPSAGQLGFICWSVNPQVHAFDNASLVEALAGQKYTVQSARKFAAGVPLVVSPVTLKPRFNPNVTGPEPQPAPGALPPQVDVRQMSLFAAGWTVGSLKSLAESAVHSATYYETTGPRGVMGTEPGLSWLKGSLWPQGLQSQAGSVFPVYHVFADVGEFTGGEVFPCTSSDPLIADGLVLSKDGRTRILLANLTPEARQVCVRHGSAAGRLKRLDETSAELAMSSPGAFRAEEGKPVRADKGELDVDLHPYAVMRIDLAEESQP